MRTKCECRRYVKGMRSKSNNSFVPVQTMEIKYRSENLSPHWYYWICDRTQGWLWSTKIRPHGAEHWPCWRTDLLTRRRERDASQHSPDCCRAKHQRKVPFDYHVWGAMLERYHKFQPKPKTIAELKDALQSIWDDMPQEPINKAIKNFTKRLKACVQANGGHFEHLM